jgi:AP-2 complex subunit mu-1
MTNSLIYGIGGLFENHNASNRRLVVAASRHQIPQKRSLRRRNRRREPAHVSDRDCTTGRRERPDYNASIFVGDARVTLGEDHLQQPSGNKAGAKATRAAAGSVTLEDCQFHQCVKLGKFDTDRIISFVPPDGEFELMRYRATENVNLPFKVHAIVNEVGKTKVEYSIAIRANYGSKLFATNVVVRIPTPLNTARITERTSQGKAKYEPEHNNIVWKIPRFTGQSEYVLSAEASLTSMTNQKAWSRPPLSLNFSLLMFTSSGLLVRYLKVFEKSNYSSVKWVRYMTRAGNYEIRYVPTHSF